VRNSTSQLVQVLLADKTGERKIHCFAISMIFRSTFWIKILENVLLKKENILENGSQMYLKLTWYNSLINF